MTCCARNAIDREFDGRRAVRDLQRFRRRGPDPSTALLLDQVQFVALPSAPTLMDIGGGIGALHHVLRDAGFATATEVDGSTAFLTAAAEESVRRGHADRVEFCQGDFRNAASALGSADVVTLDRVVCCDPDFATLPLSILHPFPRCHGAVLSHASFHLVRTTRTWIWQAELYSR